MTLSVIHELGEACDPVGFVTAAARSDSEIAVRYDAAVEARCLLRREAMIRRTSPGVGATIGWLSSARISTASHA